MLTLYGTPRTRSDRALWALEECGLPYEFVAIDLFKGEGRSPAYLAINPSGKIPALVDDSVPGRLVLTESAAICTYVADQAGTGLIPPCGTPLRARHEQWCYFAMTELEQPLWTITKHTFALPAEQRVPAVIDTARWEFARTLPVLAAALQGREYILGDQFTVADILLGHTLLWATGSQLPLEDDVLRQYLQRLLARPAYARVKARHPQ